jgi:serine/threonine-protein kinase
MTHEPSDPQGKADESDLCGTVLLGRYKVLERIGKGGMGTVYLGEHVAIGKKFAIKVLGAEYARRSDLVRRFLQEARSASMIAQQNVVEISDFGDTPDGSVFFVMEYLDGEDLGGTLQRERRLPWDRVRHMMVQVCRALEAAHAEGIVHRDMKPDNCFRITRGKDPDFIKVLDFGIAKVQTGEKGEGGKGLTQTGMVFGTPEYMAPEQAEGVAIDHRVDIYAVGVIMYELLCGRVPFSGTTFMGILTKHMFEVPEAPSSVDSEAEIPAEAEAIVLKAMQKDPKLRFASMAEMLAAIEAVGTGAAPVEVVAEAIARPAKGPTAFAKRGDGPSTAPELQPGQQARAGGHKRLWLGAAGLVIAVVAGLMAGLIVFGGDSKDIDEAAQAVPTQAPPPAPQQQAPAVVAAAAPKPEPAPTPAPDVVALRFTTNVPAQILDARDQAIFGSSDDADGVEIERSEQPLELVLRAEGYEPLTVEVVPNKDKRYEFELVKVEQRRPGDRPRPSASTPEPTPAPEPKPEPKPERPHGSQDGELKNPFGR